MSAAMSGLLLSAALLSSPPSDWPEAQVRLLERTRAIESFAARLEAVSASFLGVPYAESPLGEEEGVDADPRLRFDLVDCVTFVETALAMTIADDPDGTLRVLDDVRYGALPPSFVNRNHFVEAQWIPNNLLKGYLRDISSLVGGERVTEVSKRFGPERWAARRQLGDMPLQSSDMPRGEFHLSMVPLAVARERAHRIPSGTLLFVVRKDIYSRPTRVTHVGIVLDVGGRKVLRHAAKAPYHRVIDETLAAFLARNARYEKWPVEGVALYELKAPQRGQEPSAEAR